MPHETMFNPQGALRGAMRRDDVLYDVPQEKKYNPYKVVLAHEISRVTLRALLYSSPWKQYIYDC